MAQSFSAARSVLSFPLSPSPRLSPGLPPWSHACRGPCRPLIRLTASPFSAQAKGGRPLRAHGTPMGRAQAALPEEDPPYPSVPGKDVSSLLEGGGFAYLDVRTPDNFAKGHVPGAVNIPVMKPGPDGLVVIEEFIANVEAAFPRDAKLVVGCNTGGRSKRASKLLVEAGFTNITNVADGFQGWVAAGLPVEP